MAEKELAYYRQLPYTRRVRIELDEGREPYFVAFIEDLDGVEADGATRIEALYHLDQAFDDYVTAMLEWGDPIPEPDLWPGEIVDAQATDREDGETVSEEEARKSSAYWGENQPSWETSPEGDLVRA